ncbi:LytR/AlgR family response regulator transcription factor [Spirosoma koreense]
MTKPDTLKLPGLAPMALSQVLYLQGAGNYTIVHLLTGQRFMLASTLRKLQARTGFLRIHKSFLVNPSHVLSLTKGPARQAKTIQLPNGLRLAVSRGHYEHVCGQLDSSTQVMNK